MANFSTRPHPIAIDGNGELSRAIIIKTLVCSTHLLRFSMQPKAMIKLGTWQKRTSADTTREQNNLFISPTPKTKQLFHPSGHDSQSIPISKVLKTCQPFAQIGSSSECVPTDLPVQIQSSQQPLPTSLDRTQAGLKNILQAWNHSLIQEIQWWASLVSTYGQVSRLYKPILQGSLVSMERVCGDMFKAIVIGSIDHSDANLANNNHEAVSLTVFLGLQWLIQAAKIGRPVHMLLPKLASDEPTDVSTVFDVIATLLRSGQASYLIEVYHLWPQSAESNCTFELQAKSAGFVSTKFKITCLVY